MSRELNRPDREPLIALVEKTARALRADMIASAHRAGFPEVALAHSAVFATLPPEGARAADMAARAEITRQSMGEAVRDLVRLGILEMVPDPSDGRAKLVTYTAYGKEVAQAGFDHITDLDRRFRAELGDEEYDAARRVLERVRTLLTP
ncbi:MULTISPECIES: MarR family winged helix-turn-helix transcriptional regulator [unclassified Nocardioides]|uniref:MarR family winged helix-turn-helix transcriptional regulator n=1 Tax=unclassified Nocardioides TaxID=2615069 RepID=UPI001152EB9F|nr:MULTISPECIES: MarR family winged helix-turn-helix transcriptional regulator [unclassified Nocardioides]TQK73108.1 DNA-binding MarR family transcriptional regulator [Nocardioides sp. SLBN-35]WGY02655.1 MarR family winged helix-turn-helix transcriptional regulator [Nocardioides sp. QY071]